MIGDRDPLVEAWKERQWKLGARYRAVERVGAYASLPAFLACAVLDLSRWWLFLAWAVLVTGQAAGWAYSCTVQRVIARINADTAAIRADTERIIEDTDRIIEETRKLREEREC